MMLNTVFEVMFCFVLFYCPYALLLFNSQHKLCTLNIFRMSIVVAPMHGLLVSYDIMSL